MLGVGNEAGKIVRMNDKTVIVRLPNGSVIKRHEEKHRVRKFDA